jgi:hypothetical protein
MKCLRDLCLVATAALFITVLLALGVSLKAASLHLVPPLKENCTSAAR